MGYIHDNYDKECDDIDEGVIEFKKPIPFMKKNFLEDNKDNYIQKLDTKTLKQMTQEELEKTFINCVDCIGKETLSKINSQIFEKDEDLNFHIDFIYSVSNLRAKSYNLEYMDWLSVKLKAGRIVPALATTTAAVAGLQALEILKLAAGHKDIGVYRNTF